jgi:hypothetical protein
MSVISMTKAVPQSLYSAQFSTHDKDWKDPELIARSDGRAFQYTSPNRPATTTSASKTDFTVYRGGYQDNQLYYTTTNSPETAMPSAKTIAGPALAVFGGDTFCVYVGTDNSLYWSWTNSTAFSGNPTKFRSHSANAEPALAVYEEELWCVHTGNGQDNTLFYTKYNGKDWGRNWQPDAPFGNGQTSPSGPALVAVPSVGLVAAYRSNDNAIYASVWNGSKFDVGQKLPYLTGAAPALCYLEKTDRVMLAWKDARSLDLWYTFGQPTSEGLGWSDLKMEIDYCQSPVGAYLSSHIDDDGDDLVTCSFRGINKL